MLYHERFIFMIKRHISIEFKRISNKRFLTHLMRRQKINVILTITI
ncbi:hypothetical protein HMPREF9123_2905 [Neisseria bacilliformis ATCC BAA-1200]|uniref:Uncharacterized protein n=1 Tax=Neisseria bacilliformis ATCC BAA-1200 TaxID=888742 RepID=F2BGP8_9NEIS|nr:hypothetical protein HMPREF9123_2905 [Neisseria bacilliformis ATCC BAA-1200]